jgi:hypothetical protein
VFQPLETFFPIIGKLAPCRWASGLCKTRVRFRFRQDLQDLQDFGRPSSTGRPKTDHAAQELTTLDPPASRQHPENALFPPVSTVGTERAVVMADRPRRTK